MRRSVQIRIPSDSSPVLQTNQVTDLEMGRSAEYDDDPYEHFASKMNKNKSKGFAKGNNRLPQTPTTAIQEPRRSKKEKNHRKILTKAEGSYLGYEESRSIEKQYTIPISDFSLSDEAKEIEKQISGKNSVDLIYLAGRGLKDIKYHFNTMAAKASINVINISHNSVQSIPECLQLPNVKRILAEYNSMKYICWAEKIEMSSLIELNLSSNDLTEFPSVNALSQMPVLRTLILYSNKITNIPVDAAKKLAEIGKIADLNLSYNELISLPSEICDLSTLTSLRLRKNELTHLPDRIGELSLRHFDIEENKLVYPPQNIAELGMEHIRSYFKLNSFKEEQSRFSQFKLIVVGHQGAGKTSTIACLMDHLQQYSESESSSNKIDTSIQSNIDGQSPNPYANTKYCTGDVDVERDSIPRPRSDSISTVGLDIRTLRVNVTPKAGTKKDGIVFPISESKQSPIINSVFRNPELSPDQPIGKKQLPPNSITDDVSTFTLSIWDFAGQEVYHSAHEVQYFCIYITESLET